MTIFDKTLDLLGVPHTKNSEWYKDREEKFLKLIKPKASAKKLTKEGIVKWLNKRPFLKISAVERAAKVPHGSLSNAIAGNLERLSEKHLPEIAKVLKPYGFK